MLLLNVKCPALRLFSLQNSILIFNGLYSSFRCISNSLRCGTYVCSSRFLDRAVERGLLQDVSNERVREERIAEAVDFYVSRHPRTLSPSAAPPLPSRAPSSRLYVRSFMERQLSEAFFRVMRLGLLTIDFRGSFSLAEAWDTWRSFVALVCITASPYCALILRKISFKR